ncbi:MAG: exopolysaccharide biosynthesis protein, partial [Pseudomonadota bacterium]
FLAEPPADRLIGAACIFLAITFFPLALLPFAVFVPSVTVAIFGMALVTRDGLLTAIGLGLVAVCAVLLVYGATSFF